MAAAAGSAALSGSTRLSWLTAAVYLQVGMVKRHSTDHRCTPGTIRITLPERCGGAQPRDGAGEAVGPPGPFGVKQ